MPGPAPSKVQHWALRLSKAMDQDVVPFWDEEKQEWRVEIEEHLECDEMVHWLLHQKTGKSYEDCKDGHKSRAMFRFRRRHYQSAKAWHLLTRLKVDDEFEMNLDPGMLLSLLSKPTNPQGDGKVRTEAHGSTKQQMSVKRTTVIRV